jgi:hypothetical protein
VITDGAPAFMSEESDPGRCDDRYPPPFDEPDFGDHSKGHMRFIVNPTDGVNADVSIEFLKRLLVDATRRFS